MPPPPLQRPRENRKKCAERVKAKLSAFTQGVLNGTVSLLATWLLTMAVIELALFIATITASSLQTDTVSCTRDLTYAVIGAVSSFSGMFGARKLDRGVLLLYFVLLVWGIAATTTNITSNVLEQSKQSDICAYEETEELTSDATGLQTCSSQLTLLTVKLIVIGANIILQVLSHHLFISHGLRSLAPDFVPSGVERLGSIAVE
jgi:hypothetical protein